MKDNIKARCDEINAEIGKLMKKRYVLEDSINMVKDGEMLNFKYDDIVDIAASALQSHFDIAHDQTYIWEILQEAISTSAWSAACKTANHAINNVEHIGTTYKKPIDMVCDIEL